MVRWWSRCEGSGRTLRKSQGDLQMIMNRVSSRGLCVAPPAERPTRPPHGPMPEQANRSWRGLGCSSSHMPTAPRQRISQRRPPGRAGKGARPPRRNRWIMSLPRLIRCWPASTAQAVDRQHQPPTESGGHVELTLRISGPGVNSPAQPRTSSPVSATTGPKGIRLRGAP